MSPDGTRPDRLFLLDGMALAYRAYYALISRPLVNSRGENTSAIYGFVTAMLKILNDERPEYLAVVFDTREPTFRHKMFPSYKATRQKMPEDMAGQLNRLKAVVRAFNTPLIEVPGYEADDVIGTLARRAEREHVLTFLVTGDKDFMQLVSPLIKIYKPGKSGGEPEIIDLDGVLEKFGVEPARVIDVLGLMGDASDNVPGVPGIGEKTAIPLVQKFGSITELYTDLSRIPQKGIRDRLTANKEKALLSRELVTIDTDVPVNIDFHTLRVGPPNEQELMRIFRELEFRSLLSRLSGGTGVKAPPAAPESRPEAPGQGAPSDIHLDEHEYRYVRTMEELTDLLEQLRTCPSITIDAETTSEDPFRADLVALSVCPGPRKAFLIPLPPDGSSTHESWTQSACERRDALAKLRPILESPDIRKIGQNLKYDLLVLRRTGIELRGIAFDTMVASYVLRPDARHSLDSLAIEYLRYRTLPYAGLVGTGKNTRGILEVPLQELTDYACEDADITTRVYEKQLQRLQELGLLTLCEDVEFPLISVLADMEFAGITVDRHHLAGMSKDLERQIDGLVHEIYRLAGRPFNINSTHQLADILFNVLGLRKARKTKTGFSTDAGVLESLRGDHPIIEQLLEYRLLTKLKSTYVDALPLLIDPATGRVHTSFNQTVAATGRLASNDPNLQNIPIRSEIGRSIRQAFVPGSKDRVLMSADYSQVELRIMAHICGDPGLTEAFNRHEDVHRTTAARVFGVQPEDVTPDMRRKAKEVNFGIMYGLSPFGLAGRLEISQTEAREIIANYFLRFPGVKKYMEATIASARQMGYVSTLFGRRRYLPDINSRNQNVRANAERQAINMPIQGTAADMIKKAMVLTERDLSRKSLKARMLLQVHDELLFEVPHGEVEEVKRLVVHHMTTAIPLSVPVDVEVGTGENWLEAH
jgi:DNA polymerase-1